MKKKYLIFLCLAIIILISAYMYNDYYHKNIKASPKVYCYENYFKATNQVLIIEYLFYKEEYVEYYRGLEKGENPSFNFPLKTLPTNQGLYLVGYTSDSLLAEVVSYSDWGRFGGSYLRGYVYAKTIHSTPPKSN